MWILFAVSGCLDHSIDEADVNHGCEVLSERPVSSADSAAVGVAPQEVVASLDGSTVSLAIEPRADSAVTLPLTVAWTVSVSAAEWRVEERERRSETLYTCVEGTVAVADDVVLALDSESLWTDGQRDGVAPSEHRLTVRGVGADEWWLSAGWSAKSSPELAEAMFPGCSQTAEWAISLGDWATQPWQELPFEVYGECGGVYGVWTMPARL